MAQTLAVTTDVPNARAGLTLTWTTPSAPTVATIQRIHVESGILAGVRNAEPATLTAGVWTGYDYETPLDEQFFYLATSTEQPTVAIQSSTVTLDSAGKTWLKHPGRPALNMSVGVERGPDLSRPIPQGVFDVIGRPRPIAVSLLRNSERGEWHLVTDTDDERAAMLLLLEDGTPLLLQAPTSYGWGNQYISIGDVTEERVVDLGAEPTRRWTLPFVVVDRPAGTALPPDIDYQEVIDEYDTYMHVVAGESTYQDLVEGIG